MLRVSRFRSMAATLCAKKVMSTGSNPQLATTVIME
jgi:hypothetical protein